MRQSNEIKNYSNKDINKEIIIYSTLIESDKRMGRENSRAMVYLDAMYREAKLRKL